MPLLDTSIPLRVDQARIEDPIMAARNIQGLRAQEQEAALAPVRAQQMQQQTALNDQRLQQGVLDMDEAARTIADKAKVRKEQDALGALYREHAGNLDKVYAAATKHPDIRPETALGVQKTAMEHREAALKLSNDENAAKLRQHTEAANAIAAIRKAPLEKRADLLTSELRRGLDEKWLSQEEVETYKHIDVADDKQLEYTEYGLRGAEQMLKADEERRKVDDAKATAARARREADRFEFSKKYTDAVAAGDVHDQATHDEFLAAETPESIKSEVGRLKVFDQKKILESVKRMGRTAAQQNAIDNPTRDTNMSVEELALAAAGGDPKKAMDLLTKQKAAGGGAGYEAEERLRQKDQQDRYDKEQLRVDAFETKKDALLKENDEITARLTNGVFVFNKDNDVDDAKTAAEVGRLKAKVTANKAEHERLVKEQKTVNDRKEKIFDEEQAPRAAAKITATAAQLQAYATKKKISLDQARKEFEADGVEVK